jgi:hypothetical protein
MQLAASRCARTIGASAFSLVVLLCLGLASTAGANVTVFWSNSIANKISQAPLIEGGRGGDIPINPVYVDDPFGTAIDAAAGKVYWLNRGNGGSIGYANLDGSGGGLLNTAGAGFANPAGLAIDPAGGRIYWGNQGGGSIGYAYLDGRGGGQISIVGATAEPNGLSVDPTNGRIYWSNLNSNKISYANLDGGGANDLDTSGAPVSGPQGVAIDSAGGRVYWTNSKIEGNAIGYAALNGGSGGEARLNQFVSKPIGLAIDGPALYWASEGFNRVEAGDLRACCTVPLETNGATQNGVAFPVILESPRITGAGIPTVSGLHKPGSTLTCSGLQWQGDTIESFLYRAPQSTSFQWLRDKQPIAGATGPTLIATKVGDYLCRIAATNFAGTNTEENIRAFAVKATVNLGKASFNRRKGTATLRVAVTGQGRLDLYGTGVANAQRKHATGTAKLVVRTSGKARIKLMKSGRAKVRARISYTPEGGKAIKRVKAVVLKKRRPN